MTIDIRPLSEPELPRLTRLAFAHMDTHRRRFGLQEAGQLVFLVAWAENLPLGQALLNWTGGDASGVPPQVREGPEVSSLFVGPAHRRKGVATGLLETAEHFCFAHGHNHIGLCVCTTNTPARTLYKRLGYRDGNMPPYLARGAYTDRQGNHQTWEETRIYMVKDLYPDSLPEQAK